MYNNTAGDTYSIIQNCTVSDAIVDIEAATGVENTDIICGGIAGQIQRAQLKQCAVTNLDVEVTRTDSAAASNYRYIALGGAAGWGYFMGGDEITETVVDGLTLSADITSAKTTRYRVGGILGNVSIHPNAAKAKGYSITNCALTGDVTMELNYSKTGGKSDQSYVGGIAGNSNGVALSGNSVGMFTLTSPDVTGYTTGWKAGIFTGYLTGDGSSTVTATNPGEVADSIYAEALSPDLGYVGAAVTTPDVDYIIDVDSLTGFDSTKDPSEIATLFASFFKGGTIQLAIGETLDLNLQAFAGWAGITEPIIWASDNSAAATVVPDATTRNATITAVAAGTANIMCMYKIEGTAYPLPLTVEVTDIPPYAENNSFPNVDPTPVTPTGHGGSSNCNALGVGLLALLGLGYVVKKK
jgi:hypothetical protein